MKVVMILLALMLGILLLDLSDKRQRHLALSFFEYCMETHIDKPRYADWTRFKEQEIRWPGWYRKHIENTQK